jgi:PPOX class probable F420-dependent enzyme
LIFTPDEQTVLDMPSMARLATLMPDGSPQITVMWFRPEGDTLRMVTPAATRKTANLERDGRVAVVVEEPGNPYNFVEVRGTVEVIHDDSAARAELAKVATRYIGDRAEGYAASLSSDPRVILVIHAAKSVHHPGKGPGSSE